MRLPQIIGAPDTLRFLLVVMAIGLMSTLAEAAAMVAWFVWRLFLAALGLAELGVGLSLWASLLALAAIDADGREHEDRRTRR